VKKIILYAYVLYSIDHKVMSDPINNDARVVGAAATTATTATAGGGPTMTLEIGLSLLARMDRMEHQMNQNHAELKASFTEMRYYIGHQFRTVHSNIREVNNNVRSCDRTIADSLSIQQTNINNGRQLDILREEQLEEENQAAQPDVAATLSPKPRSLRELWLEYKVGIDGRKPAEQFTKREKNASQKLKQKYYWRNVFWQCMERLIRGGDTVDTAIMKILLCYGQQQSVSAIINKMIADKKIGGHPDLK
jgi:hypothetical protein